MQQGARKRRGGVYDVDAQFRARQGVVGRACPRRAKMRAFERSTGGARDAAGKESERVGQKQCRNI